MPRKTPSQKARNSTEFFKGEIKKAYAREIDAPLTQAMRWLFAALDDRAQGKPSEAPGLYKHATDSVAAFAEQIQHWIIEESEPETGAGGAR